MIIVDNLRPKQTYEQAERLHVQATQAVNRRLYLVQCDRERFAKDTGIQARMREAQLQQEERMALQAQYANDHVFALFLNNLYNNPAFDQPDPLPQGTIRHYSNTFNRPYLSRFERFVVTGKTTQGKRFSRVTGDGLYALSINLYNGSVWGVDAKGKRRLLRRINN